MTTYFCKGKLYRYLACMFSRAFEQNQTITSTKNKIRDQKNIS
jgi:hypothetical protein